MKTSPNKLSQPWRVRSARPEDADAIVALLNQVFSNWGTVADWHWKYELPPAPFRSPSAVAELDGKIIGHFGIVPVEAVLHGKTIRGAQTVDAAVLSAYRGCGIHSSLGRYVLDEAVKAGMEFVYAFPGILSLSVDERIGYSPVAFVPEMICVLRPWQALKMVLRYLPGDLQALRSSAQRKTWPADTIHRLARLRLSLLVLVEWMIDPVWAHKRKLRPGGVDVTQIADFDTRFDYFWEKVRTKQDLAVSKRASYLYWRYAQNPSHRYHLFMAGSGKAVQGFLAMRHVGLRSEILEFLTLPGDTRAAAALLEKAFEQAKQAGSLTLTVWLTASNLYYHEFRCAGFISPRRLHRLAAHWPFLARRLYMLIIYTRHLPSCAKDEMARLAGTWSVSLGDSDLA
jgi:GNAT superfamily N-acetyltransferase